MVDYLSPRQKAKIASQLADAKLVRQLRWWLMAAFLIAAITGVSAIWGELFPIPPEQVVKVYWTHSCRCVFSWMKELKADGFVVKSYEYDTLLFARHSMAMPSNLNGCHVGEYLGYFLEGHVAPSALHQLAKLRPDARGVVTEAVVTAEAEHLRTVTDNHSPVLLVGRDGVVGKVPLDEMMHVNQLVPGQ